MNSGMSATVGCRFLALGCLRLTLFRNMVLIATLLLDLPVRFLHFAFYSLSIYILVLHLIPVLQYTICTMIDYL
jgi:hypothetical protein